MCNQTINETVYSVTSDNKAYSYWVKMIQYSKQTYKVEQSTQKLWSKLKTFVTFCVAATATYFPPKKQQQTKTNLTLIMRCIVTIIYPAWGIIFRARPRLMQKPLPVANQKAILVCKHKNQRSSSKSISHCWVYCQSHPPSCFPFLLEYCCRTSDVKISLLIGQHCVRNYVIIIMI